MGIFDWLFGNKDNTTKNDKKNTKKKKTGFEDLNSRVSYSDLDYEPGEGCYLLKGKKYTGKIHFLFDSDGKYEKGNISEETEFIKGKQVRVREWYRNGQLKSEGGKRWYENGQLEEESNKDVSRGWYENGQLQWEQHMKNGEFHGTTKSWDESGKLTKEKIFNEGKEEKKPLSSSLKLKSELTLKFNDNYENIYKYDIPTENYLIKVESPFGDDKIGGFIFPDVKEIYFSCETIFHDGVYQREKSKDNTSKKKISKFSDDYMLNGHHDEYDHFDETNEVFKGNFSEIFLYKISSEKFSEKFNSKLKEYLKENKSEDEIYYFESFFQWLNEDWDISGSPDDKVYMLLESLEMNLDDVIIVLNDILIDKEGYQICWCQYSYLEGEIFGIKLKE